MKALLLFCALLALGSLSAADFTGKYRGTRVRSNGEEVEFKLNLKQEGSKLTGTVSGPAGELPIQDGKVEGETITFAVKFERQGNLVEVKSKARLEGQSLVGQTEFQRDGETTQAQWTVRKLPDGEFNGKWRSTFSRGDGSTSESIYVLKQQGEQITGTASFNGGPEVAIEDGKANGNEVVFVTRREREGRTIVTRLKGKLEGDKIIGQSESDWGGQTRSREWTAFRKE